MRHLTTRDQVVLALLDQHRTLTTAQIATIAFAPASAARSRLYRLRRAGWIDCFTPVRGGRAIGTHWVLAQSGARWAAHQAERRPPTPRELRDRNEAIAASSHLGHTDGQNGFFVALLAAAAALRARGHEARLARWWSPARTAEGFGARLHPDGHGVWEQYWPPSPTPQAGPQEPPDERASVRQVGFLLEWDTGTETLGRLLGKLEAYRRLRADGTGPDYPILFVLPSLARETNLHTLLSQAAVPTRTLAAPARPGSNGGLTIATTHTAAITAHPDGPAGSVWRLAGNGRRRHHLAELPSTPGEAGPFHPGPPDPSHDPLALMAPAHA